MLSGHAKPDVQWCNKAMHSVLFRLQYTKHTLIPRLHKVYLTAPLAAGIKDTLLRCLSTHAASAARTVLWVFLSSLQPTHLLLGTDDHSNSA